MPSRVGFIAVEGGGDYCHREGFLLPSSFIVVDSFFLLPSSRGGHFVNFIKRVIKRVIKTCNKTCNINLYKKTLCLSVYLCTEQDIVEPDFSISPLFRR